MSLFGAVVELVTTTACHAVGHGFESRPPRSHSALLGAVVELVTTTACHAVGHGFESRPPRSFKKRHKVCLCGAFFCPYLLLKFEFHSYFSFFGGIHALNPLQNRPFFAASPRIPHPIQTLFLPKKTKEENFSPLASRLSGKSHLFFPSFTLPFILSLTHSTRSDTLVAN